MLWSEIKISLTDNLADKIKDAFLTEFLAIEEGVLTIHDNLADTFNNINERGIDLVDELMNFNENQVDMM